MAHRSVGHPVEPRITFAKSDWITRMARLIRAIQIVERCGGMTQYYLARTGESTFIIEPELSSNGFLLLEIRTDGVWDTWHPNVEEAKAQASHSLRKVVGPWAEIDQRLKDELIQSRKKN